MGQVSREISVAALADEVPAGGAGGAGRMSSLSRRACYKCGNVGHYAEVCSSSERLCYNCKQPGKGETVAAGMRRGMKATLARVRARLRGLGHVQADCPTLRLSGGAAGGRCYSCGQAGHLARNCPNPNTAGAPPTAPAAAAPAPMGRGAGGFRGGRGGGFTGMQTNRAATCYKCGGPNHFARDCQAQAMKCYACGKLGHISRDCTAPNGGAPNTAGKTCYKCGQPGHISRECTQVEGTNGDAGGAINGEGAPVAEGSSSGAPVAA
ncbi:gig suppressor [Friedmanniomyces endolithicus]|nr:gig suppressor [Friedmanniomyces endolithicus]